MLKPRLPPAETGEIPMARERPGVAADAGLADSVVPVRAPTWGELKLRYR